MEFIELLCRFISFAEKEIEYFRTPFPDIAEKFGDEKILSFYWHCVGDGEFGIHLSGEAKKTSISFFLNVGSAFSEESLKICRYSFEVLNTYYEKAKADFPKRTKTDMSLALLVGAGISVVLM